MRLRLLTAFMLALACALPLRAETAGQPSELSEPSGVSEGIKLLMVEQTGCHYCQTWDEKIGPIYSKTDAGAFAPLRRVMISADAPEGVDYARPVLFTPTFLLLENGAEIGRIEGYPGEDFFWGLLEMMLADKTAFSPAGGAAAKID